MSEKVVSISKSKCGQQVDVTQPDFYKVSADLYYTHGAGVPLWLCAGDLEIVARILYAESGSWGLLIRWHDSYQTRNWVYQAGANVLRQLERGGLKFNKRDSFARTLLMTYITELAEPSLRITYIPTRGWHGDLYVTRELTIGQQAEYDKLELDPAAHDDCEAVSNLAGLARNSRRNVPRKVALGVSCMRCARIINSAQDERKDNSVSLRVSQR